MSSNAMELSWDSKYDPDNAQETLEDLLASADRRLLADMQTAALNMEAEARRRVPVDTGNLRGSIDNDIRTGRNTITAMVGSDVPYSIHVEKGTKHMEAQPYVRPAIDSEIRDLMRRVRETVNKAARSAGGV